MPVSNKYRHYKLRQAKRRSLNIGTFGGVDLSSQRFNVLYRRAIDAENFIYKDGVIQVREGFEELYDVTPKDYIAADFATGIEPTPPTGSYLEILTNGVNFNGMWKFVAEDEQEHIVAHIGNLLYEIKNYNTKNIKFEPLCNSNRNAEGIKPSGTTAEIVPVYYSFEDFKSFAFVGAKKLWFLGGNKYMVIRFVSGDKTKTILPVENNDITFVPKTTIGITYTNARTTNRENLDYPNMLQLFRRNTLISGIGKQEDALTETKYFEYVLDSGIYLKDSENDMSPIPTQQSELSLDTQKSLADISIIIEERGTI